jgi:hypothetical protein
MCTILLAPQMSMTKRFENAASYQDFRVNRAESTEDRKRQLSMKWVVVTDEQGNRRLRMHWTVPQSPIPLTVHKARPQSFQPAVGRVSDPTPRPEVRVVIS